MQRPKLGQAIVAPLDGEKFLPPMEATVLAISRNNAEFIFLTKPPIDHQNWSIHPIEPGYYLSFTRPERFNYGVPLWSDASSVEDRVAI